ncbi:MAG: hypothetical protein J2P38_04920, partial [Candidatus Dormibacteraeota bacterium]|nr:hypothetical protein [Candidatus Dormibacteraeota bacterium]
EVEGRAQLPGADEEEEGKPGREAVKWDVLSNGEAVTSIQAPSAEEALTTYLKWFDSAGYGPRRTASTEARSAGGHLITVRRHAPRTRAGGGG